jgi:hypothetical protein
MHARWPFRVKYVDALHGTGTMRIARKSQKSVYFESIVRSSPATLSARLGHSLPLGLPDEQIPDASAEVKECGGYSRTHALKDEETRAWIDVGVCLAFECKAECDK